MPVRNEGPSDTETSLPDAVGGAGPSPKGGPAASRPRPVRTGGWRLTAGVWLLGAIASILVGWVIGTGALLVAAAVVTFGVSVFAALQVQAARRERDQVISSWLEPVGVETDNARRAFDIDQTCREIETALEAGEVELWYQPIVHSHNGAIAGFEGLVRWHKPESGLVMPGTFIDQIENTDTIIRLSDYALRQALRDLPELTSLVNNNEPYIGINVSVHHLVRGGLAEDLEREAKALGVSLDGLVIELTERSLVPLNDERLALEVAALQRRGVLVAVDDFGAGYANLMTLNAIDVDFVKVDRALVVAAATPRGMRVLNAASGVIRSIGAVAVAEGIGPEEESVIRRLPGLGFDLAQGHVWGEARPLSEFVRIGT